jgi:hypothetical protein
MEEFACKALHKKTTANSLGSKTHRPLLKAALWAQICPDLQNSYWERIRSAGRDAQRVRRRNLQKPLDMLFLSHSRLRPQRLRLWLGYA